MQDQSQLFYIIAAINVAFCLLFLWRTVHFAATAPDCERLRTHDGRITSYSRARNWYGTPELNISVGTTPLRVHAGPWLSRIRHLARSQAEVRVSACPAASRRRLWALWHAGQPIVTPGQQQSHARGVARATLTMSLLFALAAALFIGAELRAA